MSIHLSVSSMNFDQVLSRLSAEPSVVAAAVERGCDDMSSCGFIWSGSPAASFFRAVESTDDDGDGIAGSAVLRPRRPDAECWREGRVPMIRPLAPLTMIGFGLLL